MPIFEIDNGAGKTFEVDAPSMPEAIKAFRSFSPPQAPANPQGELSLDNLVRSAAQGIPVVGGAMDKIAAGMDALTQPVLGRGSAAETLGERYAQNLGAEQAHTQAFETANPIAATAANLAGGIGAVGAASKFATGAKLLGLTGKTLPAQMVQGGLSGGALSAADAAVRGQNPIDNAGIGAALGVAAPVAGRVIGAAITNGLGRAISPVTVPKENAEAINVLKNAGVNAITAGQQSGSRALKYAESELGNAIGSGGKATTAHDNALQQFTAASASKIPEFSGTSALTPEALNDGFNKISSKFTAVAERNPQIKLDSEFQLNAEKIKSDFKGLTGNEPTLIDGFLKRITPAAAAPELPAAGSRISKEEFKNITRKAPNGPPVISGATYQAIRSEIGELARSASRPEVSQALYKFQNALDQAVGRNLPNKADKEVWSQARRSWLNALILKDALNTSTDTAAKGFITPAKLTAAVKKFQQDGYTRGRSDFAELARAGNIVMKEMPNSGTAPRAAAHFVPSMIGAGLGGGIASLPGAMAGAMAPGIVGRLLMSDPVQAYLLNQRGAGIRALPMLGFSNAASIAARGIPSNIQR